MRTYKVVLLLLLFGCMATLATAQSISGEIFNKNTLEPVIGASIVAGKSEQGVVSDVSGKFTIDVQGAKTITVSSIGFATQTISLSSLTAYRIELEPSNSSLEQVVVVGYGSQKKANLTGAV